ncbi:hypothetical protein LXL04_000092 [Taraxacum kok-saghyz]
MNRILPLTSGMVEVKCYFPENTPDFRDFRKRFRQKFSFNYPHEEENEPGIFAVQGYNAVKLLEEILPENFVHKIAPPQSSVEIVNVVGKGYNSVYWTEGLGFSERVDDDLNRATTYTDSILPARVVAGGRFSASSKVEREGFLRASKV